MLLRCRVESLRHRSCTLGSVRGKVVVAVGMARRCERRDGRAVEQSRQQSGPARRAGGVAVYAGSGDVADGIEVGVRVAMALGWERPRSEAMEGHGQRRLTGVAV